MRTARRRSPAAGAAAPQSHPHRPNTVPLGPNPWQVCGPLWPNGILEPSTNMLHAPALMRRYQLRHVAAVPVVEEIALAGDAARQVGRGWVVGGEGRGARGARVCVACGARSVSAPPHVS